MFTKSVEFYDAIYEWKDYRAEAERLRTVIQTHARRPVETLLDVACGTGQHLVHLKPHFAVEGLDLNPEILATARRRHPDVVFHHADMVRFDLPRRFDVVTCLFASIAYAGTVAKLHEAVGSMRRHVRAGGLVIVEPFVRPEDFQPGRLGAIFVDRPDLKIARLHISAADRGLAVLPFHYLVATPSGVEHFVERHELALFSHDEYLAAFRAADLTVRYEHDGLMGRGLYIGLRGNEPAG
ncbi:MAG TPA: class I SAM-dependent methyltransferase [bacterium]|nr:class I SAM-dependent methyltransferase [bacterium]